MRIKNFRIGLVFVSATTTVFLSPLMLISCRSPSYRFESSLFNSEEDAISFAEQKLEKQVELINKNEKLQFIGDSNKITEIDLDQADSELLEQISSHDALVKRNVDLNNKVSSDDFALMDNSELLAQHRLFQLRSLEVQRGCWWRYCSKNDYMNYILDLPQDKSKSYFRKSYLYSDRSHCQEKDLGLGVSSYHFNNNGGEKQFDFYFQIGVDYPGKQYRVWSHPIYTSRVYTHNQGYDNNYYNYPEVKRFTDNFFDKSFNVLYEIIDKNGTRTYSSEISEAAKYLNLDQNEYIFLNGNQNESHYVIDLNKTSNHDYYGPYVGSSSANLSEIKNTNLWKTKKVLTNAQDASNGEILADQKMQSLLLEFFDLLVPDLYLQDNLFNIPYLEEKTNSYQNFLKKNSPEIWKNILDLNMRLVKGQRNSILLKAPIIYNFIADNIVKLSLSQDFINETNRYFSELLKYLDGLLRIIFPADVFQNTNSKENNVPFSLLHLFKWDRWHDYRSTLPLVLSLDYVSKNYANFLPAIKIAMLALQNKILLNGVYPYDSKLVDEIVDSNGIFNLNSNTCKLIWNIFSSSNFYSMLNLLERNMFGSKITEETKFLMLLGYFLKLHLINGELTREYLIRSSVALDPSKAVDSSDFFKKIPNSTNLIQSAEGNYGLFLVSSDSSSRQVGQDNFVNKQVVAKKSSFLTNPVRKIIRLANSAFECFKNISPNLPSLANHIKNFSKLFPFPSVHKFVEKISNVITKDNLTKAESFLKSISDVSGTVSEINNVINDVWEQQNPTPVNRLTYEFMNQNYFVDNNQLPPLSKQQTSRQYNDAFVEQLFDPIRIDEPRNNSVIYYDGEAYPLTEKINEDKLKFILLYNAQKKNKKHVGNVRLYYSILDTEKISKDLNDRPNNSVAAVESLLEKHILSFDRKEMSLDVLDKVGKYALQNFSDDKSGQLATTDSDFLSKNLRFIKISDYERNIQDFKLIFAQIPQLSNEYQVVNFLFSHLQDDLSSHTVWDLRLPKIKEFPNVWDLRLPKIKEFLNVFSDKIITNIPQFAIAANLKNSISKITVDGDNDFESEISSGISLLFDYFFFRHFTDKQFCFKTIVLKDEEKQLNRNSIITPENQFESDMVLCKIYSVLDPNTNEISYFLKKSKAFEFLVALKQIKKNSDVFYVERYVYNSELLFFSLESFHQWVKSNIKKVY